MVSEVKIEKVQQIEKIPVRIKFSKTGKLKYISHLDLNRTMQRIIVRAKIPVWYTEGYNPIPKIVFASPLSLGSESYCEYMDLKLVDEMGFDDIKNNLNRNMPAGLEVTDVYSPVKKFSEAGYSEYEITVKAENINENTETELKKLFTEPLVLIKRTKSGEKETDILPFINSIEVNCDTAEKLVKINTILASDSEKYLNPEYLIKAMREKTGIFSGETLNEYYTITRKNMYEKNGISVFR